MSAIKTRELESALLKKGFRRDDKDHRYYWLFHAGRKTSVHTKISHGEREYGEPLLGLVGRQMGLNRRQLFEFVECPLTQADYEALLLRNGRISAA